MKRKMLFFLLGLLWLVPLSLRAYDFQSGDLYYNITSSTEPYTAEVTCQSSNTDNYSNLTMAIIPETIIYDGTTYIVTGIGAYAFSDCSSITLISIPESITTIGKYAFYGCTGLTSVTIPNYVTSIGNNAFLGCSMLSELCLGTRLETIGKGAFDECMKLFDIYCYAANPPAAGALTSFGHYNSNLYVPCESLDKYQRDAVFGSFKYIMCMGAEDATLPSEDVTVIPSNTDATFIWPSNGNANAYTLVITKDGVVFCTLNFNANGQLMGIAFAPSKDRNNAHAPQAAQATTNGWQFTVTGLNEGSKYAYTMTVTDNSNKVLQTYDGTFTTLGGDLSESLTQTSEVATGMQKIIRDGQVLIQRNGKTYTLTGQEVR